MGSDTVHDKTLFELDLTKAPGGRGSPCIPDAQRHHRRSGGHDGLYSRQKRPRRWRRDPLPRLP